jgi:predicted acyl esterase
MALKTVSKFPSPIVENSDLGIVMPDGCCLSARVWMPVDAIRQPVPAIVEHLRATGVMRADETVLAISDRESLGEK